MSLWRDFKYFYDLLLKYVHCIYRSYHIMKTLSMLCFFVFVILLNIRLLSPVLTWWIVFAPLYALLLGWIGVLLFITLAAVSSVYKLKVLGFF